MKEACDNLFFKMQSRLGELERSIGRSGHPRYNTLKIRRLKMEYKNMQGKSKHYLNYKSLAPMPYLKNLLEYLNKNGLK